MKEISELHNYRVTVSFRRLILIILYYYYMYKTKYSKVTL